MKENDSEKQSEKIYTEVECINKIEANIILGGFDLKLLEKYFTDFKRLYDESSKKIQKELDKQEQFNNIRKAFKYCIDNYGNIREKK